jgi:hypothetical protein
VKLIEGHEAQRKKLEAMPKSEMKGSKGALVVDMDELERDYTEAMKVSTYTF